MEETLKFSTGYLSTEFEEVLVILPDVHFSDVATLSGHFTKSNLPYDHFTE